MDQVQALQITKYLSEAYPRDEWSQERFVLWADAIADLDFRATQKAAREWVMAEKWPPTVAEIRELSKRLEPEYQPKALQLCPPWEPQPDLTPEQMAANKHRAEELVEEMLARARRTKASKVWSGVVEPDAPTDEQVAALEAERRRQLQALQKSMDEENTA
jgi:hypothetical protein